LSKRQFIGFPIVITVLGSAFALVPEGMGYGTPVKDDEIFRLLKSFRK